ncbi:MAG: hypothetical protein OEY49_07825 [Candidatus Heimdallarchaeota archaeon]|nr:hypothetical protein [Candidatus Heimdallarchaeota archaeon]
MVICVSIETELNLHQNIINGQLSEIIGYKSHFTNSRIVAAIG